MTPCILRFKNGKEEITVVPDVCIESKMVEVAKSTKNSTYYVNYDVQPEDTAFVKVRLFHHGEFNSSNVPVFVED